MAKSKNNLFESKETSISEIAKSLAHPARVQILKLLLIKSPQNCSSIVEQIPLAQATVSQHLAALKFSGLLTDKKEGNMVLYSADRDLCIKAHRLFSDLFVGHLKDGKQQKLF
ncbi:MAG: metalloregulator ArsR/SmtB family transcription factor [Bacteroidia bacterium]|jgi:DNA-binding transcriptional ArsR family regulator|nr:helix-turn-helix transcriptional regulator [Bacteroidia bacterium]MCO5254865.1 metalloregulator ArsR/SmtB family transcription factor [Bacteroidota bacterium]MCZ2128942.1 metalloregulator ArsR/SmtB family transcription factor [Bacteroidia bacterium]